MVVIITKNEIIEKTVIITCILRLYGVILRYKEEWIWQDYSNAKSTLERYEAFTMTTIS